MAGLDGFISDLDIRSMTYSSVFVYPTYVSSSGSPAGWVVFSLIWVLDL